MYTRIVVLLAMASLMSGCIATPRIEIAERFDFSYQPDMTPQSYADLLCCHDCHA